MLEILSFCDRERSYFLLIEISVLTFLVRKSEVKLSEKSVFRECVTNLEGKSRPCCCPRPRIVLSLFSFYCFPFAQIFQGNSERQLIVTNRFRSPIRARFVRIYPRTWHGHISMRIELYGCSKGNLYNR